MGVSPPGGGVPDSGAKLVRLRRYRSVSISPSSGAENGGQDGPSATYVLPKLAFAGKHCGEFLDKRNTINATVAAPRRVRRPGDIICPNPNGRYEGPPRKVARGSILVGVVLLLFFILPGILYFIFMQGYRYDCPKCGLQIIEFRIIYLQRKEVGLLPEGHDQGWSAAHAAQRAAGMEA